MGPIKVDSIIAGILVLCAIGTTAVVFHKEFATSRVSAEQSVIYVDRWKSVMKSGLQVGPSNARIQLIEFLDFECPFCAEFNRTLEHLRKRYPTQLSLTYIHFPLPMHKFAAPAARVVECAAVQGRFEAMHNLLFEQQDKFGLKSWVNFAKEAGVLDLTVFETCIQSISPIPRVEAGKVLGKQLDIQGTPTLIVNGWKLAQPPSLEELDRMVKAILAGKSPVSKD